MKLPWTRLIRFVATDGRTLRGEPILPSEDFDLGNVTEADQLQAKVITGDDIFDTSGKTKVTDETVTVKKILGPLTKEDVPVIRAIGLNYAKHSTFSARLVNGLDPRASEQASECVTNADEKTSHSAVKEAGRQPPPFPFFFFKPNTCLQDHDAPVVIPKLAQDDQADYEGELVRGPSPLIA
jgi:2-keto-4-pentenoate hydratase/2-oxohepta-3-ene-1,7-dioic acid hydratase in catechol pathway